MINKNLFIEFLRVYAFQPATGFWRSIEVDVLQKYIPKKGTCLDLGCGDGKLTSILYDGRVPPDLNLIGIDSDQDETSQAATYSFYNHVHTCTASNIPEEDGSFDHAFSNSVLEHIQDIEATLNEISRLLKPGGTFVFTVPSPGFHRCLYGPLDRKSSREIYLKELDNRLAHYRYWSTKDWETNLSRCGMIVEEYVEYFNCHEVRRWENISRFTAGIIYAIGQKKLTPIESQKKLGLRQAQNRIKIPRMIAALMAFLLSLGVQNQHIEENACLLILARKTATDK